MKKTGKKGFTLTELCVVLALIAIVSGMVVSFALLISGRTKMSTARLDAMGDLEMVESVTGGWMSRVAAPLESDDGLKGGDGYTLSFNEYEKTLTGTLPGNEEITVKLDHVVGVEYELLRNSGTGDYLCICTVELKLPRFSSSETEIRTICINPNVPNVGDTYT